MTTPPQEPSRMHTSRMNMSEEGLLPDQLPEIGEAPAVPAPTPVPFPSPPGAPVGPPHAPAFGPQHPPTWGAGFPAPGVPRHPGAGHPGPQYVDHAQQQQYVDRPQQQYLDPEQQQYISPTQPNPGPASLDDVPLVNRARPAPAAGWRRLVYKMSGGLIRPGDSPADVHHAELAHRINQPVRGDYRIAVLSLKGGVGKTVTAVGLGATLASVRGDRVIAVDANPDLGTLAQRIPQQTQSTVRDLIADPSVSRYSDVRIHTSQAENRLEVLASERDPAKAETFDEDDYRKVMEILRLHYNIIITDCGTGVGHSAMYGVLGYADILLLVTSPAIDGARSAAATLDWLVTHGYGDLAARAIIVVSATRSGADPLDTEQLTQHFLTRTRSVHTIPFDPHLAEGAEIDLDLLSKRTRNAFLELAATIAEGFADTVRRE
ncbi:MAG: AAA family ATPase [Gordonia sp. (in: high G+C Gram-positive bacteria)]|uniref:MinD/ParA family ATP-binding protein n=1 Tax=Gordonia sp. (in: high G+C Gram-positive bacteria) TaxID=84139 RepID=UPI0039E56A7E